MYLVKIISIVSQGHVWYFEKLYLINESIYGHIEIECTMYRRRKLFLHKWRCVRIVSATNKNSRNKRNRKYFVDRTDYLAAHSDDNVMSTLLNTFSVWQQLLKRVQSIYQRCRMGVSPYVYKDRYLHKINTNVMLLYIIMVPIRTYLKK